MKKCNRCETEKEFSEFSKDKTGKYGIRSICKKCTAVNINKWYQKNKKKKNKLNSYNQKMIIEKRDVR